MLFELGPEGVRPLDTAAQIFVNDESDILEPQVFRSSAEKAFIEAGLCDEDYIDSVNNNGVGSLKADLHKHKTTGAEPLIINPSFNSQPQPHFDIVRAIQNSRSQ